MKSTKDFSAFRERTCLWHEGAEAFVNRACLHCCQGIFLVSGAKDPSGSEFSGYCLRARERVEFSYAQWHVKFAHRDTVYMLDGMSFGAL